jgi:hypothetical protein
MGLKIQRNIISYLVVALVLLTIVVPWEIILPTTYAQQSSTAQPPESQQILQVQGLGINPFIIEIDAEPGDTIEKSISLTNTTDKPLSFLASINDFVPNGTSGQPIFLPTNQDANPKYSVRKSKSLDILRPNPSIETKLLKNNINSVGIIKPCLDAIPADFNNIFPILTF